MSQCKINETLRCSRSLRCQLETGKSTLYCSIKIHNLSLAHRILFHSGKKEKWMHDFMNSDWTKQINERVRCCSAELRIIWSHQMFMHFMATSLTNRWIVTLLYNPEMGRYQFEESSAPTCRRTAFRCNISTVALISVLIDYGWASGQCRCVFWSLCSSREHLTVSVHHKDKHRDALAPPPTPTPCWVRQIQLYLSNPL